MDADLVLFESCHIKKKIKYHDKGFKNDKYLHLYSLGKGTMGNGSFQNVSEEKGHFILWETGHSTFWESDHLSSGIRDILSSWNRTTYPPGNGTRYPLGIGPLILWEISSWNREFGR